MALQSAIACTSAIVSANATKNGRPLLWKNRDTGTLDNFVARVTPKSPSEHEYVALYNAGDSTLSEAWIGLNDQGFAIMNTASYNLAPDTAKLRDREGVIMSQALRQCRSTADFATLLDTLPRPMGVQANFGVIDAMGGGGYFEVDDLSYRFYSLDEAASGVLVRTNYSFSGAEGQGMGYIRYDNACHLLQPHIDAADITPLTFTNELSCSFYHSLLGDDILADSTRTWIVDQDFIPRRSTSASVVIEGVNPGDDPLNGIMWTALGYPPVATVKKVTLKQIPNELLPDSNWHSPECDAAMERKRQVFPNTSGSGPHYIYLPALTRFLKERTNAQ